MKTPSLSKYSISVNSNEQTHKEISLCNKVQQAIEYNFAGKLSYEHKCQYDTKTKHLMSLIPCTKIQMMDGYICVYIHTRMHLYTEKIPWNETLEG